jgi:hypothetical protein
MSNLIFQATIKMKMVLLSLMKPPKIRINELWGDNLS